MPTEAKSQKKGSGLRAWLPGSKKISNVEDGSAQAPAPKPKRTYTPRYAARDMALSMPAQQRTEQKPQANLENLCSEIGFGLPKSPSAPPNLKHLSVHSNLDLLKRQSMSSLDGRGRPSSLRSESDVAIAPKRPGLRYSYSAAPGLPLAGSSSNSPDYWRKSDLTPIAGPSNWASQRDSAASTSPIDVPSTGMQRPAHHRSLSAQTAYFGSSVNDFAYEGNQYPNPYMDGGKGKQRFAEPRRQAYFSHNKALPNLRLSRNGVSATLQEDQSETENAMLNSGKDSGLETQTADETPQLSLATDQDNLFAQNSSSNASFVGSYESEGSTRTPSTSCTIITEVSEGVETESKIHGGSDTSRKPHTMAHTTV